MLVCWQASCRNCKEEHLCPSAAVRRVVTLRFPPAHLPVSDVLLLQGPQAAGDVEEADVPDSDAADSSEDELASEPEPAASEEDVDDDERQRYAQQRLPHRM